jgi:hypothetical protein
MRSPLDPAFVLPWYEFPELDAMEPRERARVVEESAERVTTQPAMLATWAVTLALLVAVVLQYGAMLREAPVLLVLGGALLAFVPLLVVRRALVRRTVQRRLAEAGQAA